MLVFAGHAEPEVKDGVAVTNELWAWYPATRSWELLQPGGTLPARRHGHGTVWDPVGRRLLDFGGWDILSENRFNDLWAYDPGGNRFSEVHPTVVEPKPQPRPSIQLTVDATAALRRR